MQNIPVDKLRAAAKTNMPALTAFTQRLVQTPSLPGHEEAVAAAITAELHTLGYDDVWTDEVGNVIGKIKGGPGPAILLNGHMDHVDPGPAAGWPHPPFSGIIENGELWGRASVDMKGPVACMAYAGGLFKQLNLTPPGDVYCSVVVIEEIGGLGTEYLADHLKVNAAICGEPSRNILRRGHRGRVELAALFQGRSAHASVPHLAINPHYQAAAFLAALPNLPMAQDHTLGASTVAPTLYTTDQTSPNVTPGQVRLTLDWRNTPTETPARIVAKVAGLLNAEQAAVQVSTTVLTTYTGVSKTFPSIFPAFLLAADNPFVQAAHTALTQALGRDDGVDIWRFATDGGHLMAAGIPTVGFGPGDERLAHTNQERLNLAQMQEAVVGYVALILALAHIVAKEN